MNGKLNKLWTTSLAVAACTAALSGVPQVALAESADFNAGGSSPVNINKTVNASTEITTTGDVFTFTFTPQAGTGTTAAEAPAISNKTVTAAAMTGSVQELEASDLIPDDSAFPHAGVYRYRVDEAALTGGKGTATGNTITTDSTYYYMDVYVVNTSDSANPLEVSKVMLLKNGSEEEKSDSLDFTNTYTAKSDLTITQETVGTYADKTKEFPVSVELTFPSWVEDGTTIVYTEAGEQKTLTVTGGKATINANLKDGETIVFAAEQLPVGTTYKTTETPSDGYTITYSDTDSGTIKQPVGNSKTITATYQEVTPTGLIVDNLPYILMVGGPLAVLGVWFANRRRQAQR